MFAPVMTSHKGLTHIAGCQWAVRETDPHFVFRLGFWPARYLVIELVSSGPVLDPRLYIDTGHGFRDEQAMPLPPTRHGLYLLKTRGIPGLRRLRLDPCEDRLGPVEAPGSVSLTLTTAHSPKAARRRLGSRGSRLQPLDLAPLAVAAPPRYALKPDEYFRAIVRLAEESLERPDLSQAPALISFVVPLHDTPRAYLDDLIGSFLAQRAQNWELLLCDDASTSKATLAWLDRLAGHPRIRILRNERNEGIAAATNLGLAAARGDWVGLVDHDDALAPLALDHLNAAIARHPQCQFIYTDEVVADAKLNPNGFFFKPAYDPVLLSGVNYINHLSVYRRERLAALGGLHRGYDGSQDYDLLLRYLAGLPRSAVVHLPYPAYLWRRHQASYSSAFLDLAVANARRALGRHYGTDEAACPVGPALAPDLHRVDLARRRQTWPLVSIVIPNRDGFVLIERLLGDLQRRTDYPHVEIIVVDNGTTDARTLALYDAMRREHPAFRLLMSAEPFNFARQVNRGLRQAQGEAVLLLNNDVEVADAGWLKEMVSCLDYPEVGIVGARLLYPSGRLQHAGVIVGLGGLAGHWYGNAAPDTPGPMNRLKVRQTLSAVTGACMLISRACRERVGDFDETEFAIAYNDVDYCLRAASAGFHTVWTPFATLMHHESASRGSDETEANRPRFQREKAALRRKYRTDLFEDPAFSPWYSPRSGTPREILPERLPEGRRWTAACPAPAGAPDSCAPAGPA